jgi:hypothetical protein
MGHELDLLAPVPVAELGDRVVLLAREEELDVCSYRFGAAQSATHIDSGARGDSG